MHTYLTTLELRGGLGTPLAADTLWGHLCWGLRYADGEAALVDWLARYDGGDPPLVLSDPLPAGFWPRPALPSAFDPERSEPPRLADADQRKQLAKRAWISGAAWQAHGGELSPQGLQRAVADSLPGPPEAVDQMVLHAGVNRLTGGTAQAEGGTLFSARKTYFAESALFDVWCLSPEPPETVRRWFELGLFGGYGRDASSGLGHIEVRSVAAAALPECPDANALMLLGPAVPRPGDPHRGFFNWGVRCGRVGGAFAIGELPGGRGTRQKRPVRCLLAGSILLASQPQPRFLGRVLRGVHEVEDIRHFGLSVALPCRLAAGLLDHPLLQEPAA